MPSRRYYRDTYDDDYEDVRVSRQRSVADGVRTQEVPYENIQRVRERALASMQQPRTSQELVPMGRSRGQEDQFYGYGSDQARRPRRRYPEDEAYDYRRHRRQDSAPPYEYNDDRGGDRRRSRRNRDAEEYQNQQDQRQQNETQENEGEEEEKTLFDRSCDGVIAGAAGAAIGAMTARHFASPKQFSKEARTEKGRNTRNWKMLGGAVAGAAAFNLAENQIKQYLEEKADRKEDIQSGGELLGEGLLAFGPNV